MINRNREALVNDVVAEARSHIGFRSRANRINDFGAAANQDGRQWNGSFLESCFIRSNVSTGTSLISTAASLAYYSGQGRLVASPRVGDLAFYAFSLAENGFGQLHVGLVTEVRDFKSASKFRAIEGMVDSGTPKGPQDLDGVYERTRYDTDVLAFARPVYVDDTVPRTPPKYVGGASAVEVQPSHFRKNRTNKQTVALQRALSEVLGVGNFTEGVFDSHTASAVRRYQVESGMLPADGVPDEMTLFLLMSETHGLYLYTK